MPGITGGDKGPEQDKNKEGPAKTEDKKPETVVPSAKTAEEDLEQAELGRKKRAKADEDAALAAERKKDEEKEAEKGQEGAPEEQPPQLQPVMTEQPPEKAKPSRFRLDAPPNTGKTNQTPPATPVVTEEKMTDKPEQTPPKPEAKTPAQETPKEEEAAAEERPAAEPVAQEPSEAPKPEATTAEEKPEETQPVAEAAAKQEPEQAPEEQEPAHAAQVGHEQQEGPVAVGKNNRGPGILSKVFNFVTNINVASLLTGVAIGASVKMIAGAMLLQAPFLLAVPAAPIVVPAIAVGLAMSLWQRAQLVKQTNKSVRAHNEALTAMEQDDPEEAAKYQKAEEVRFFSTTALGHTLFSFVLSSTFATGGGFLGAWAFGNLDSVWGTATDPSVVDGGNVPIEEIKPEPPVVVGGDPVITDNGGEPVVVKEPEPVTGEPVVKDPEPVTVEPADTATDPAIADLKAQIEALTQQNDALVQQNEALVQQNEALTQRVETLETATNTKIEELGGQVQTLTSDLEAARAEIQALKDAAAANVVVEPVVTEPVVVEPAVVVDTLETRLEGTLNDARALLPENPRGGLADALTRLESDSVRVQAQAIKDLGYYFANGFGGVAENDALANKLFGLSMEVSDGQNLQATRDLGYQLVWGFGQEADVAKGCELINTANDNGSRSAGDLLKGLKKLGMCS